MKRSKSTQNYELKQDSTRAVNRPFYTTDANGRLLPINYKAVDNLPNFVPNFVGAEVSTNKKKKAISLLKQGKNILNDQPLINDE